MLCHYAPRDNTVTSYICSVISNIAVNPVFAAKLQAKKVEKSECLLLCMGILSFLFLILVWFILIYIFCVSFSEVKETSDFEFDVDDGEQGFDVLFCAKVSKNSDRFCILGREMLFPLIMGFVRD
jgi:hypothetical protein